MAAPNTPQAEAEKHARQHEIADGFYWFEGTVRGKAYTAPAEIRHGHFLMLGSDGPVPSGLVTGSFFPFESYSEVIAIW